jgi:hypothetical protein
VGAASPSTPRGIPSPLSILVGAAEPEWSSVVVVVARLCVAWTRGGGGLNPGGRSFIKRGAEQEAGEERGSIGDGRGKWLVCVCGRVGVWIGRAVVWWTRTRVLELCSPRRSTRAGARGRDGGGRIFLGVLRDLFSLAL